MTKQEAIKNHREMWNWIADQLEERVVDKTHYFDKIETPQEERPLAYCFCCEYAKTIGKYGELKPRCDRCPIKWPVEAKDKHTYCLADDSPYKKFYNLLWFKYEHSSEVPDERIWRTRLRILARQIANLPEKED